MVKWGYFRLSYCGTEEGSVMRLCLISSVIDSHLRVLKRGMTWAKFENTTPAAVQKIIYRWVKIDAWEADRGYCNFWIKEWMWSDLDGWLEW